jgi:hypothetical protein
MPLPKKIKKNIPLTESKILLERRQELVDKINKDGTYLPKSLLHADLDGGFLDFVKNELRLVVEGKVVPTVDVLITTQNWAQFTQTWDFQTIDKNVDLPFISVVRTPEVKYGTNPSVLYTIPNRRQYFYVQVPTWDGQRSGIDVYKIPQPVPVDITFQVKIVCNRMRELNAFNKIVIEKFSSLQAYQIIKGHYIPIKMTNITDESVMDVEKRKYYIQSYEFLMMGFLIDENEFEVSPAVNRVLQVLEVDERKIKRQKKVDYVPSNYELNLNVRVGTNIVQQKFDYTANIIVGTLQNITSFDVYINNDFYGTNITNIQININDTLKFEVTKDDTSLVSTIELKSELL